MTPYRTTPQRAPLARDLDVMRFGAQSHRARRQRRAAALATVALVVAGCLLPLAVSAHGVRTLASAPMPPRRMPPVHAVVVGPWTCMPRDGAQPMAAWEIEAELGREVYDIDCANTFW